MTPSLNDRLDKAIATRNCCVAGLCAAWLTGFAGVAGGFYCTYLGMNDVGRTRFIIPHAAKEVLPLGINIIVTFLNESMGYIHSTTVSDLLASPEAALTFAVASMVVTV